MKPSMGILMDMKHGRVACELKYPENCQMDDNATAQKVIENSEREMQKGHQLINNMREHKGRNT